MPYNEIMSKHTHLTGVVTYDIRINEQQRRVLQEALRTYISAQPGEQAERDEFGTHVAASLEDMLDPDGSTGQLAQDGINSFVL